MSTRDNIRVTENEARVRGKLHANDRTIQQKGSALYNNSRMIKTGPIDFDEKISQHEGGIMALASRDAVTMSPTTSIINAIRTMTENGFRRIPVTDAGTNRLEGIVTSVDIIDFLGGGSKNLLVEERHKGNLLAAINSQVREIMQTDVVTISDNAGVDEAIKTMLEHNTSGLPIVDSGNRVVAICTEKDLIRFAAGIASTQKVDQYMSRKVKTTTPDTSIGQAARIMIDNGFRRIPIVNNGKILGMVTASDIMHFLGNGGAFDKLTTGNIHEAFDEPVLSLISKETVKISPKTEMGEAANIMVDNNIGSLPVMEGDFLVGIITERDFLRAISE
ncbi:CBS domain-containing protein [Methanolobus sp.]|uniref:CBS domain-containing protein n=1 Tax=Methanolobus sp. TaxID=1874737 RepID=UPI0025DE9C05|nr:CBS domain-containing protein [Methanolobus sp.]